MVQIGLKFYQNILECADGAVVIIKNGYGSAQQYFVGKEASAYRVAGW
jgi:hypothetical protein